MIFDAEFALVERSSCEVNAEFQSSRVASNAFSNLDRPAAVIVDGRVASMASVQGFHRSKSFDVSGVFHTHPIVLSEYGLKLFVTKRNTKLDLPTPVQ